MGKMITQQEVKLLEAKDFEHIFGHELDGFKHKPRHHQYASALWSWRRDRVLLLLGIGTGKTFASLLITHLWKRKKVLVVCPNSVRQTWKEELEKHTNETYTELVGTKARRKKLLENKTRFYIVNYEGLKVLFGRKVKLVVRNTIRSRYVTDHDAIMDAGFDCLVIDEVHHCRNFMTVQTQIAYNLSKVAGRCIALTGSPVGSSMTDFWSEFMVLDQGETFGPMETEFLHKYFNSYEISVNPRCTIVKWSVKKGCREKILELVEKKTLRYDAKECFDMPKVTYERRYVQMTVEQLRIYFSILNDLIVEFQEGKIKLNNVINKTVKLRQVMSGFIIKNDVTPEGVEVSTPIRLKANPKLDELEDLLGEIEGKVIIYHSFVEEGRMIEARLKKMGVKYASMRGEKTDRQGEYKKFKRPDVRVLVAHPVAGGEGLNLQESNVMIFFSQVGGGGIYRPQAEGRIVRAGQERPCIIVDLLAKDSSSPDDETIDERMYTSTQGKKDFAKSLLDWLRDR